MEENQAVNMRDLARFLKLYRHLQSPTLEKDKAIATALNTCYTQWHTAVEFGLIKSEFTMPTASLIRTHTHSITFESLHKTTLNPSDNKHPDQFSFGAYQDLKGAHSKSLHKLLDCL
jgi:hypothetical protein